jgi:hypothetical protein
MQPCYVIAPQSREVHTLREFDRNLHVYATTAGVGSTWEVTVTSTLLFNGYKCDAFGEDYSKGRCALVYKKQRTQYTADVVDENTLIFRDIPSKEDAQAVIDLVDAIIRRERISIQLRLGLTDILLEMESPLTKRALKFDTEKGPHDTDALTVRGARGNISLHFNRFTAMVFFQSKVPEAEGDPPHLFEALMKHKYEDIDWNGGQTNVLVFEGREYPNVEYSEGGVYEFSFEFPERHDAVREHVLMLARILISEE